MSGFMKYWSISSIVLVEEAKKLGLKVEIISKEKNLFFIKGNNKEILFKSTDFGGNHALGNKCTNDKELAYKVLEKHDLPIAKSHYISKKEFKKFEEDKINNLKFPLIIKPINEGHGNGVMMNILNIDELKEKLAKSFLTYKDMIIQEQIEGDEVRVLVVKGEIILAINRVPASITGDNENSIKKLIEIENDSNSYRGEGYEDPLSFIKIDNELSSFIKKQNLNINSIPEKGEEIQLRGNSNIGTGGTMIDVTKEISNDIKKMCIKTCEKFKLEMCGIDILTSDITKPLDETGGIILELNPTPGIGGDRELTSVNTGREILKLLFF